MAEFVNRSFEEARNVTFAVPSPDEKHILYGVGAVDLEKDKNLCWLWLYDTESGSSRRLTYAGGEKNGDWLDENTVYFSASRDEAGEGTQFYALNIHGGEAYRLFSVPVASASAYSLGRGKFLIYGNRSNSDANDGNQKLFEVYDEYPYHADGRAYVNKYRSSLWLYDMERDALDELTEPLFQVNQVMNSRISPILSKDKKRVYFWGENITTYTHPAQDIYVCDLETGECRLFCKNDKYELMGGFEHKGRLYLVGLVVGADVGDEFYGTDLISVGEGELDYRVELKPDCVMWNAVAFGDEIAVVIEEHDKANIYTLTPDGGTKLLCSPEFYCKNSLFAMADVLYYVGIAPMKMMELACVRGGKCCQLTDVGGSFVSSYPFTPNEELQVKCPEGHTVYGWVVKPHGYEPGKKYPGLLMIHGGPQGAYRNELELMKQRFAAEGYFVFFCNPRGSTNYGREFMNLTNQFGFIDYDDIMHFTDAVLESYPDIDPERLGVTGGSYGGYMTNWIVGHTDRFKAAISQRSISNWISMYGCTDISYFVAWGQGGTPWDNPEELWLHSPIKYANNFKTPTLFLQNDKDYRCPVEQAEQMLTAMIEHNVPSRMVLFHNASHSVMTPLQQRRRDDEIIAWLNRYAKGEQ